MSGRTVVFHTAVAVVCLSSGFEAEALVPVTVRVRQLADREIEHYLRTEQPYDCAGSAKSETLGIALLDAIESDDPTALVGLPLIRTCAMLRAAGLDPLAADERAARCAAGCCWCRRRWISASATTARARPAGSAAAGGDSRRRRALTHWVAENARTARAFLKRVDAIVPLAQPLQALHIVELPRPAKGAKDRAAAGSRRPARAGAAGPRHRPRVRGRDACRRRPGRGAGAGGASPGHRRAALPGASSLLLALAASGLNGQSFAFVGYLPVEAAARAARIRELEALSRRAAPGAVADRDALSQSGAAGGAAGPPAAGDALVGQLRPDLARRAGRAATAWRPGEPGTRPCRPTCRRCSPCRRPDARRPRQIAVGEPQLQSAALRRRTARRRAS